MAKVDMAAVRAKLLEAQNKGNKGGEAKTSSSGGDNASYPFWDIPENTSASIRLLPDGDESNDLFWVERQVIKLPFEGVVGGDYPTNKPVEVTIPCVDMFPGMMCPIISETRPWWKTEKEDLARVYYKKRSYLFQGFVVNSPLVEKNTPPENPIRRFVLNKSIFEIIHASCMDPEMEDAPTDYDNGTDFRITKTKQGQYANYKTSSWSRKTRSLSEAERGAIDTFGLFKLKDYLGRIPDADELAAIKAMFHESLDGQPFDAASYGKYYRAFGGGRRNDDAAETSEVSTSPVTSAPVHQTEDAETPVQQQSETSAPRVDPQSVLERIRNRGKA